jgi:hypothetical protein
MKRCERSRYAVIPGFHFFQSCNRHHLYSRGIWCSFCVFLLKFVGTRISATLFTNFVFISHLYLAVNNFTLQFSLNNRPFKKKRKLPCTTILQLVSVSSTAWRAQSCNTCNSVYPAKSIRPPALTALPEVWVGKDMQLNWQRFDSAWKVFILATNFIYFNSPVYTLNGGLLISQKR